MDLYYLIHETSIASLDSILKNGFLLTSSKTQHMEGAVGQGSKNRRLAQDPSVSLTKSDFYELYDEVDGVYMRLQRKTESVRSQYSECVMLFSSALLRHHRFVINTEENFGFLIDEEGVVNESQFSGEPGFSITSLTNIYLLEELADASASEVLIRDDVSTQFLRTVFFTKNPPDNIVAHLRGIKIPFFNIS